MNERTGAGMHARLFRGLLRLYPASFRVAYGDEMTHLFIERLGRAASSRGRFAVARLWARTVVDVIRTSTAERLGRDAGASRAVEYRRRPMTALLHDLRDAARALRKTPVFTACAVAILTVGIGLNAAVFSLADTTLFRPAPFEAPERLVHIYQDSDTGVPSSASFPAYRDIARMTDLFAGVGATARSGALWERADGPHEVSVEYATASYFPVLGLEPERGRWFGPEHDRVGAGMAAVVSHRTWRTRLNGDPDVVGRTVRLNNQPVTIIGVGPREFNGQAGALITDFWLSISSTPVGGAFQVANLDRREDHWYLVTARLAPGVSTEEARARMQGLAERLAEAYPELNEGRRITVFAHDDVRFHPSIDAGALAGGMSLIVIAALVLVLACSNLANLLLVRGVFRRPEMALRTALGAGWLRVARLPLLEALMLSALGGIGGLLVAWWAVRLVPALPLETPGGGLDVRFDHRVVLFGAATALVTGVLFGLLPALRSVRLDAVAALREDGRAQSAGRGASLVSGTLVALQVALSVVLVIGAGLLTQSLANIARVDPGVDTDRIAVLGTNLVQGGVPEEDRGAVAAQLLERAASVPGIERAALTTRLPLQTGWSTSTIVEGYEPEAGTSSVELDLAFVGPGYFETMGITRLAGRGFTAADEGPERRVVIVNEAAARMFWGGDAIGRRVRPQGDPDDWQEVVGVVADVKVTDLAEPPTPMLYRPIVQSGYGAFSIVARTAGDPAPLMGSLRRAVREVRAALPVTRLASLDANLSEALAVPRLATGALAAFSALALLLAVLGIYAVVSFTVQQRTRELGIRAALGAPSASLVAAAVTRSLVVAALGVAIGLGLAALAMQGLEGVLFGVRPVDAATFGGAAALLLLAAGLAALLPARRAARADPVRVLRAQ